MALPLDRIEGARAVLLAGPTASGKSTLALRAAEHAARSGREPVIVNADSMQVYDALRVLTARPSAADAARFPYRLYGHVPAEQRYSVGAWLRAVEAELQEPASSARLPIFVGGTGLYFKALTQGLASTPPIPADIRERWTRELSQGGPAALHAALSCRDAAAAARIRPSDPQRLLRALEVLDATGRPLAEWQERQASPLLADQDAIRFVVTPDRATLYRRIEDRLDGMVAAGALEEVAALIARRLDPALPAMKAIGVREFAAFLSGRASMEEAVAKAKMETRRYAKRQMTWLRRQMPDWKPLAV